MLPLTALLDALRTGRLSASDLLAGALARIADPAGEGERTFLHVSHATARSAAAAADALTAAGAAAPPLSGVPISVKDLFDVAGERTMAGSVALRDAEPAARDATAVARLRAAGAVLVGRTNMTEFAYSGVGLNPHHGTPRNPYDRSAGRIPGGSSSGAAVSVTDDMAAAALGTDTGGSCRIPAGLCGIVGFKPTAGRVPQEGVVPLSPSFDAIGVLARTVRCVATVDAVIAGQAPPAMDPPPLRGVRLLVVTDPLLEELDDETAAAFDRALGALSAAGAVITERPLDGIELLPALGAKGGIVAAEAYAWHEPLLRERGAAYDPRVRVRIEGGAEQSAADYIRAQRLREELKARTDRDAADFDAIVAPTTPCIAPRFAAFQEDAEYYRLNRLLLRNTSLANALDRCSISVPCHPAGEAPVGLMLTGSRGGDRALLALAAAVEPVVAADRAPPRGGAPSPIRRR